MRLSSESRAVIKRAAEASFGGGAVVRLFGSRVDDTKRGGDIDVLIETTLEDPGQIVFAHTRFLSLLYQQLGEQKIDVLIDYPGRKSHPPIFDVARREGLTL